MPFATSNPGSRIQSEIVVDLESPAGLMHAAGIAARGGDRALFKEITAKYDAMVGGGSAKSARPARNKLAMSRDLAEINKLLAGPKPRRDPAAARRALAEIRAVLNGKARPKERTFEKLGPDGRKRLVKWVRQSPSEPGYDAGFPYELVTV